MTKQHENKQLEDAVTLLEMDDGHDKEATDKLIDRVNTLKDTIQAQQDYEEQEAARQYMAERNLQAETPTKIVCNQIKRSKEIVKLTHLLKERKLTQAEQLADPTQKQCVQLFSQSKIKDHVKDFILASAFLFYASKFLPLQ